MLAEWPLGISGYSRILPRRDSQISTLYVGGAAIACIMTLGKCRPSPEFGDLRPLKMQAEPNA
jgi:hypothetical protein